MTSSYLCPYTLIYENYYKIRVGFVKNVMDIHKFVLEKKSALLWAMQSLQQLCSVLATNKLMSEDLETYTNLHKILHDDSVLEVVECALRLCRIKDLKVKFQPQAFLSLIEQQEVRTAGKIVIA